MADEQRKNPRSIDERLDAITMNLELQIRETESLRESMRQQAEESRFNFDDVRDSIRSILKTTEQLMITAQAQETRLQRLERRAG